MSDQLAAARKRGKIEIEDFIGTFVLDYFDLVQFAVTDDDHHQFLQRQFDDRTLRPGVVLCLDGITYEFVSHHNNLRWISLSSGTRIPLYGREDSIRHTGPFVVDIRNRWDVMELSTRRYARSAQADLTLEAKMLYATCDNLDSKVLFELGDEIVQDKYYPGWVTKFVSRWHPNGITPTYLEGRDPDEPEPIEIVNAFKPYEPKHGRNKSGRARS